MPGMDTIPGLDFTAIDFEAANSSRNSACSAGYAMVRDGIITDSGSWLIYPHTAWTTGTAMRCGSTALPRP